MEHSIEEYNREERPTERRKRLDHERYMRNREVRLMYQRAYYAANRESVIRKVMECTRKRVLREKHAAASK